MSSLRKKIDTLLDKGHDSAFSDARKILLPLTEKQDGVAALTGEAAYILAELYCEFEPESTKATADWLQKSAKSGFKQALYKVARLHGGSPVVPFQHLQSHFKMDPAQEQSWLALAAEAGSFEALWDLARKAEQAQNLEKALDYVKQIKKVKSTDLPDEAEALQSIKALAEELQEKIEEHKKHQAVLETSAHKPGKLRPEQMYNAAIAVLETDPQKAEQLLKTAAEKGLIIAKKKLAELKKKAVK